MGEVLNWKWHMNFSIWKWAILNCTTIWVHISQWPNIFRWLGKLVFDARIIQMTIMSPSKCDRIYLRTFRKLFQNSITRPWQEVCTLVTVIDSLILIRAVLVLGPFHQVLSSYTCKMLFLMDSRFCKRK